MERRAFLQWLASIGVLASAGGVATQAKAQLMMPNHEGLRDFGVGDSLYHPSQYLFISCATSNFISVYDIKEDEHLASLDFDMQPLVFELARDDSVMVVGNPTVSRMSLFELTKRARVDVELPSPLHRAYFLPLSKFLAVGLRDQVGMYNYETGELFIYPERWDSNNRQDEHEAFFHMLFSVYSRNFWILDQEKPVMHRHSFFDPHETPWETIDFSAHVPSGSGLAIGFANPVNYIVALTLQDSSQGLVYFPEDGKVISTGALTTDDTPTTDIQIVPYTDSHSQRILFAHPSGRVAMFNLLNGEEAEHYDIPSIHQVDFSPRTFRSGWLDRTWILGGANGIVFQDYDKPENTHFIPLEHAVIDMWVSADSKTLYYIMDEEAPTVHRMQTRNRKALPPLAIQGIVKSAMLRMGSNNSICY